MGHVSGCHVNPAVTTSLFVTGDIKLVRAVLFIVVQCIGALAGSALLKVSKAYIYYTYPIFYAVVI